MPSAYRLLLFLKFAGVLGYAGGFVAAFVASSLEERKRAVHAVASPGLLLVWSAGYALTAQLGIPLTELWIFGSLLLSLASLLALVQSVSRGSRTVASFFAAALPLAAVLALMVTRPTWASLGREVAR